MARLAYTWRSGRKSSRATAKTCPVPGINLDLINGRGGMAPYNDENGDPLLDTDALPVATPRIADAGQKA